MAVQLVPATLVKPFTVKFAGSDSDAVVSSLTTVPELHDKLTVTFAELCGANSFRTVNVAEFSRLVIVQEPDAKVA